jgi:transposase-like protein
VEARRKYTPEFKQEAVELSHTTDNSVAQIVHLLRHRPLALTKRLRRL